MNPRPHPTTFLALTPSLRARIENTIDHLVALLDTLDGDSDFEPANDDEPSFGWSYSFDGAPLPSAADRGDDRELDPADDEDGGDLEPELWLA
jgi:hypothetical protein